MATRSMVPSPPAVMTMDVRRRRSVSRATSDAADAHAPRRSPSSSIRDSTNFGVRGSTGLYAKPIRSWEGIIGLLQQDGHGGAGKLDQRSGVHSEGQDPRGRNEESQSDWKRRSYRRLVARG